MFPVTSRTTESPPRSSRSLAAGGSLPEPSVSAASLESTVIAEHVVTQGERLEQYHRTLPGWTQSSLACVRCQQRDASGRDDR